MIPLRDDQPTSAFPIITVLLIALNVLVYLGQQVLMLDSSFAFIPYELTHHVDLQNLIVHLTPYGRQVIHLPPGTVPDPASLGQNDLYYGPSPHPLWLTIFSSMFMHASLLHIGGNMLYLWIFGNNIEDALGKVRFLIFYVVCGVLAAFAQTVSGPNSIIPNVGASGAIAGVLAAYWILYPDARVLSIVPIFGFGFLAEIRAYWVLGLWIVLQLAQGFGGLGMQRGGGVAYFAHIGGFIAGLVIIQFLGGPRLVARQKLRAAYDPPPSGGNGWL